MFTSGLTWSQFLSYTIYVTVQDKSNHTRTIWRSLFRTTEGHILLFGILVAILGLAVMGLTALWSTQTAHIIGAMSFTNIIFGRAVSLSLGYAAGYSHNIVIPVNIWIESVLVLLFYPLFVFSMRKLVVLPRLRGILERTRIAAERHQVKVRRYGILGLFAFVWFPFWMTGPVVGSAIGFLLGFPSWLTISVVLIATYIAIGGWAYILFGLHNQAMVLGPWAPVLIVILIAMIILTGYWLNQHAKNQG